VSTNVGLLQGDAVPAMDTPATARERFRVFGRRGSRFVVACVVALLAVSALGGCTRPQPAAIPRPADPVEFPDAEEPSPPVPLSQLQLEIVPLWKNFTAPLYLTNAGDGSDRIFILEQGGTIRIIRNGSVTYVPYLDVSELLSSGGERGLLGLAFAPDFETSGSIYINYTDERGDTVVARYTADDPASDEPKWSAPETVLTVKQPFSNHNGGCLQFGPDGLLYVGMGDGGSAGDPDNNAQDSTALLGKMVRIDVSGTSFKPEVWAKGLRNPWRFSFDESSGALWIGDVGQGAWEEINVVPDDKPGVNYGWNRWEGTHVYPEGSTRTGKSGFTFPIAEYPHPEGESVTGGYVYRGTDYPAMIGTYVYADFVKGWIGAIQTTAPDGTKLAKPEERTMLQSDTRPASFGVDEDGELYLVDYRGTIYGVTGAPK